MWLINHDNSLQSVYRWLSFTAFRAQQFLYTSSARMYSKGGAHRDLRKVTETEVDPAAAGGEKLYQFNSCQFHLYWPPVAARQYTLCAHISTSYDSSRSESTTGNQLCARAKTDVNGNEILADDVDNRMLRPVPSLQVIPSMPRQEDAVMKTKLSLCLASCS